MKKKIYFSCFLIFVLLFITACSNTRKNSTFSITFLNVGQGDAALVECDGHYMLIDGGPVEKDQKYVVYQKLVEEGVTHLDILCVSHCHADHIGGLPKALTYAQSIDEVWCIPSETDTDEYKAFRDELDFLGCEMSTPQKDRKYSLGSSTVEVLDYGNSGNDSIVLLITYGSTTFLFTGDIEHNMEERLCERYSDDFPVTLLKVSHHGSSTSTSYRFLRMLMPQYAVISVGKNNIYQHPSETVLSRLEQAGVEYYRTDIDGTIVVSSTGTEIKVDTQKENHVQ